MGTVPAASPAASPCAAAPGASRIPILRDPKRLFRLLEEVLGSRHEETDAAAFLRWSVERMQDALAPVLGVEATGLFAEHGGRFVLDHVVGSVPTGIAPSFAPELPGLEPLWAQSLLVHPDPNAPGSLASLRVLPSRPSAATVLTGLAGRHVLFLLLGSSCDPTVVELVLNTVRAVVATRDLQDRWRRTLREAVEIQRGLLPREMPTVPGLDVAGRSNPAEEVGGDFFDFFPGPDALGVAVGDASGHGLPAALVARDVVAGLRMGLEDGACIEDAFSRLNRVLHRGVGFSTFVSTVHVEVGRQGDLLYVNAGHPPPIRVGPEGTSFLLTGDTVLGLFEDAVHRCQVGFLEPGEALVLYTDGVIERRGRDDDLFGEDRLARTVADRLDRPASEIVDAVFEEVARFGAGAWQDDATLVVVKRLPRFDVRSALRTRHRV